MTNSQDVFPCHKILHKWDGFSAWHLSSPSSLSFDIPLHPVLQHPLLQFSGILVSAESIALEDLINLNIFCRETNKVSQFVVLFFEFASLYMKKKCSSRRSACQCSSWLHKRLQHKPKSRISPLLLWHLYIYESLRSQLLRYIQFYVSIIRDFSCQEVLVSMEPSFKTTGKLLKRTSESGDVSFLGNGTHFIRKCCKELLSSQRRKSDGSGGGEKSRWIPIFGDGSFHSCRTASVREEA